MYIFMQVNIMCKTFKGIIHKKWKFAEYLLTLRPFQDVDEFVSSSVFVEI